MGEKMNLTLSSSLESHYHIFSIDQFSKNQLLDFFNFVADINSNPLHFVESLKGKILATLFFESSTRTRLSFESAMFRCGGQVVTVEDGRSTSIQKGETLEDMGKVVSQYADLIVVRHPEAESCNKIAQTSDVPIINAGDGGHEHPTQALLDLYTIFKHKKNIDGLKVVFFGDLKYARTVNSTIKALAKFDISFIFISQDGFELSSDTKAVLKDKDCVFYKPSELSDAISQCDILYITRVQKERMTTDVQSKLFFLTQDHLNASKSDLMILHPLPRVDEMDKSIDNDPKAYYFEQAKNGVFVRMALLNLLLNPSIKFI